MCVCIGMTNYSQRVLTRVRALASLVLYPEAGTGMRSSSSSSSSSSLRRWLRTERLGGAPFEGARASAGYTPRMVHATSSASEDEASASTSTSLPPKAVLRDLLAQGPPRTADALWVEAEKRGLKSKRFMKMMLKQMRERGEVETRAGRTGETSGKAHESYTYAVRTPTS